LSALYCQGISDGRHHSPVSSWAGLLVPTIFTFCWFSIFGDTELAPDHENEGYTALITEVPETTQHLRCSKLFGAPAADVIVSSSNGDSDQPHLLCHVPPDSAR